MVIKDFDRALAARLKAALPYVTTAKGRVTMAVAAYVEWAERERAERAASHTQEESQCSRSVAESAKPS